MFEDAGYSPGAVHASIGSSSSTGSGSKKASTSSAVTRRMGTVPPRRIAVPAMT